LGFGFRDTCPPVFLAQPPPRCVSSWGLRAGLVTGRFQPGNIFLRYVSRSEGLSSEVGNGSGRHHACSDAACSDARGCETNASGSGPGKKCAGRTSGHASYQDGKISATFLRLSNKSNKADPGHFIVRRNVRGRRVALALASYDLFHFPLFISFSHCSVGTALMKKFCERLAENVPHKPARRSEAEQSILHRWRADSPRRFVLRFLLQYSPWC
jgi:hypothetical protein